MAYLMENRRKRHIYIDNQPKDQALKDFMAQHKRNSGRETIPVRQALGRQTSKAVYAAISSPHYHSAAMDGIALKASITEGANERSPKLLKERVDFTYINTGYPIPEGYDAVIMIEDVIPVTEGQVKIIEPAYSWQHVRLVGEDMVVGEMILPGGHRIRALDIGALLSGGVEKIEVVKPMRVGIIPTGNEVTRDIDHLKKGQIIDSNSGMFAGLVSEAGGHPKVYDPVKDDPELLGEALTRAVAENDLVVINAGSSAGSKDYTVDIIKDKGEVIVHGIAMKPGKPTILGIVDEKPVIGIPGYPVSAYFAFMTFADPLIRRETGEKMPNQQVEAVLAKRIVSSLKHEEYVRVTLGKVNKEWIATPLQRGAGNTTSLVKADGILTIPRHLEGIEGGDTVTVNLMKALEEVEERAVFIGSHDIMLDIIGDMMPVSSAHVGSLGGILAMRKEECLLAPIHLLDEETGRYNEGWVSKYFPKNNVSVIRGVHRQQGMMVAKGNPKGIHGFQDLTASDVRFVNRQKGSGTRQLVDWQLKQQGIEPSEIDGYRLELTTHMAVAVAVDSGTADVGIGTYSAAQSLELDFIPIGFECYDFLVADKHLNDGRVLKFIDILTSDELKDRLTELGGYSFEDVGMIKKVGVTSD